MEIQGIERLTLLDWPGRVACTVFLGGCDFRCPFCHNSPLVAGPMPDGVCEGELLAFLNKDNKLLLIAFCSWNIKIVKVPDVIVFGIFGISHVQENL